MEFVQRDEMTAERVIALEHASQNPLCPEKSRTPRFFELLEKRSKLPVMDRAVLDRFLSIYLRSDVSISLLLPLVGYLLKIT
jgi:hypothetical protein